MNQETVRKNPHPEMHERATKPYRTDWVCPLAWGHEKPRVFQSSIARGRNFYCVQYSIFALVRLFCQNPFACIGRSLILHLNGFRKSKSAPK